MASADFQDSQKDLFDNIEIKNILNSLDEGAFVVDNKNRLIFYNNIASSVLNADIEGFIGSDVNSIQFFENFSREQLIPPHVRDLASGYKVSNIYKIEDAEHYFENEKIDIHNEYGEIKGVLYLIRDITKEINLELKLSMEVKLDSLSGLYNSKFFYDEIEKELSRCSRYGHDLGILFIDINNFKFFNDTFGHKTGDDVIKLTGESLKSSVRKNIDTVYRYGGDEFIALLPNTPAKRAVIVANRILLNFQNNFNKKLKSIISDESYAPAFENFNSESNKSKKITLSTGITEYKKGKSATDLVREADKAMYTAKKDMFTHIYIYDHETDKV